MDWELVENILGASLFCFSVSAKKKELKHEQRSTIHILKKKSYSEITILSGRKLFFFFLQDTV